MASQPSKRARFCTEEVVALLDDDLDLMGEVICEVMMTWALMNQTKMMKKSK